MHASPVLGAALVAFFGLSPVVALPANVDPRNVIQRDVAIIGGGSSGTNIAIQLKDAGKSVIVIEAKDTLGGHTHTYVDSASQRTVDYGVNVFHNITLVRKYFERFNIPLSSQSPTPPGELTVDYTTGAVIDVSRQQPSQQAIGQAVQKYIAFLTKYPQLAGGMFLPRPVPQELVIPFSQLARQLGIEAIVPLLARLNAATGDINTIPAVEFIRVAGLSLMQQIAQSSFVTTTRMYNSELYLKAQAELNSINGVLLNSRVIASQRKQNGVELTVKTPQGIKYICAKRLVVAIPPRLDYLKELNPTQAEREVFSKFQNTGYYTTLVKNAGLPPTLINNINPQAPFGIPNEPGVLFTTVTAVPNVYTVYYAAPRGTAVDPLSEDVVKARIVADLKRIQTVNQANRNFTQTQPEFVVFKSHAPFYLQVSAQEIQAGFYDRMNALQGNNSTFFTGAVWRAHDSSMIWQYNTNVLLPMLLKSL